MQQPLFNNIPGFVLLYRFFCFYRNNPGFSRFYCIYSPCSTTAIQISLVFTVYISLVLPQQSRFLSFLLYIFLLFYRSNPDFSRFYCITSPCSTVIIRDSLILTVYSVHPQENNSQQLKRQTRVLSGKCTAPPAAPVLPALPTQIFSFVFYDEKDAWLPGFRWSRRTEPEGSAFSHLSGISLLPPGACPGRR